MKTIAEAQKYVRVMRTPLFDAGASDDEFARVWARRHGWVAVCFFWFAAMAFSLGVETRQELHWALLPLGLALEQGARWFRLQQAQRLFRKSGK
jgi:hypothetical protein